MNHRIPAWQGLEGTSVGHPVQPFCRSRVTQSRLHRTSETWWRGSAHLQVPRILTERVAKPWRRLPGEAGGAPSLAVSEKRLDNPHNSTLELLGSPELVEQLDQMIFVGPIPTGNTHTECARTHPAVREQVGPPWWSSIGVCEPRASCGGHQASHRAGLGAQGGSDAPMQSRGLGVLPGTRFATPCGLLVRQQGWQKACGDGVLVGRRVGVAGRTWQG